MFVRKIVTLRALTEHVRSTAHRPLSMLRYRDFAVQDPSVVLRSRP